jgi:hypothetical protein
MKHHTVEQLQEMVEYCRERHRNPDFWLSKLQATRIRQLKAEVSANRRKEREAKRAAVTA